MAMKDHTQKQKLEACLGSVQSGPHWKGQSISFEAAERLEGRFKSDRCYSVLNIVGNKSIKELLEYAARQENCREQDIVRRYLLTSLEERYGNDVPYAE